MKAESDVIATLYKTEAAGLRALARKRLDDPHEADDLVNEAFRILSERWESEEIAKPGAFLMTVLARQINSHLRKKYRRRFVPIDETQEDQLPTAPDVADQFQIREERALVMESVQGLRSKRQQRVLQLTGLDFRPGEIARMETEAGRPATSHQISCVLRRSLANLRLQFTERGLVPSFLPGLWITRVRSRFLNGAAGAHLPRMFDAGAVLQIAVAVALAGMFGYRGSAPNSAGPPDRGRARTADAGSTAGLLSLQSFPTADAAPYDEQPGPGAPRPQTAETKQGVPSATASLSSIPLSGSLIAALPESRLPVEPQTHFSQSEDRADLRVQPISGEELTLSFWKEESEEPAPSLVEQTKALVENPDSFPRPECGGLPICSDPEGDNPPDPGSGGA